MKAVIKKALDGKTLKELQVIASLRGLEFPKKVKKADLVKQILDSGTIEAKEFVRGRMIQVVVRLV